LNANALNVVIVLVVNVDMLTLTIHTHHSSEEEINIVSYLSFIEVPFHGIFQRIILGF